MISPSVCDLVSGYVAVADADNLALVVRGFHAVWRARRANVMRHRIRALIGCDACDWSAVRLLHLWDGVAVDAPLRRWLGAVRVLMRTPATALCLSSAEVAFLRDLHAVDPCVVETHPLLLARVDDRYDPGMVCHLLHARTMTMPSHIDSLCYARGYSATGETCVIEMVAIGPSLYSATVGGRAAVMDSAHCLATLRWLAREYDTCMYMAVDYEVDQLARTRRPACKQHLELMRPLY